MVEIYYVNINCDAASSYLEEARKMIPKDRKEKSYRFRFRKDQYRCVYSSVLVQYLISDKVGKSEKLQFTYNEYGKPYYIGENTIYFNCSHSGDYIVCALSTEEIGVDIERIGEEHFEIARRCFSPEENHVISSKKENFRRKMFYTYWTLKESYVKLIGKGLSIPFQSFSFIFKDMRYQLKDKENHILFYTSVFQEDYILSIASLEQKINSDYKQFSIPFLVKELKKRDLWGIYV